MKLVSLTYLKLSQVKKMILLLPQQEVVAVCTVDHGVQNIHDEINRTRNLQESCLIKPN